MPETLVQKKIHRKAEILTHAGLFMVVCACGNWNAVDADEDRLELRFQRHAKAEEN